MSEMRFPPTSTSRFSGPVSYLDRLIPPPFEETFNRMLWFHLKVVLRMLVVVSLWYFTRWIHTPYIRDADLCFYLAWRMFTIHISVSETVSSYSAMWTLYLMICEANPRETLLTPFGLSCLRGPNSLLEVVVRSAHISFVTLSLAFYYWLEEVTPRVSRG